jgi:DNA-binding MarR family transcriptional regulator
MATPRWLDADEARAWRGYRRMRALLDLQISRDLSRDSGISDSDYDVMSTLSEKPGRRWRANALARRLMWSTSRLSHHVARMERRGLVTRQESADDGRGAEVSLSETGWEALQAAAPQHLASVRQHFIDVLTPVELKTLSQVFAKVIEHLGEDVEAP